MPEKIDSLEAVRKKNQALLRQIERCLQKGTPHPRARYFVWGDSLFYGWTKKRTPGFINGIYVQIAQADDEIEHFSLKVLKRIAKTLNEKDRAAEEGK